MGVQATCLKSIEIKERGPLFSADREKLDFDESIFQKNIMNKQNKYFFQMHANANRPITAD